MAKYHNVKIIVLGYTYSHIIRDAAVESQFVYFNGLNVSSALRKIKACIDGNSILHAFDLYVFFIVRLLRLKLGNKIALTKCGGPNPKGYFPKVRNLVLFSQEDFAYFSVRSRYNSSKLYLIPNRTEDFITDTTKVEEIKNRFNLHTYDKVILRICRISRMYQKSIVQSIHLHQYANDQGCKTALIILGNIQDQGVIDQLKNDLPDSVFFLTEDRYTANAKEVIEVADWVVGTGRGFMEASAKSRVMFAVSMQDDLPMLIGTHNFDQAFAFNFSERIIFEKQQIVDNKIDIIKLFSKAEHEASVKKQSLVWFKEYFSIQGAIEKYGSMYKDLLDDTKDYKDLVLHWFKFIRANLGTWYRELRKLVK
ncbi:hypothetical protein OKW96_04480 [Sphingobacterium sp. KU25419]|nr:hypothetical protein OKW96_04480 [Sphingobacterium sp. KU25419]